jgi:predicted small secreted protein
MKKTIYLITVSVFAAAAVMSGCSSPAEKVENAKENLQEAKVELSQAQSDSVAEYEIFMAQSGEKITANEKAIQDYKASLIKTKKQIKSEDQKILDALEQKNIDLRKKMEDYKENGKDEWSAFKTEFNHDMDELGKAIKDLAIKNTK